MTVGGTKSVEKSNFVTGKRGNVEKKNDSPQAGIELGAFRSF